jgi:diguanylate cyclase (GGDEF)-like protein
VAAEVSLALPPGPTSQLDTVISAVLLVTTALLIALPWKLMPSWATVIVPVTYAGSVLMLILAAGGSTAGVGTVILIPLIWTALYHRRWESAVVVAVIVAIEFVSSLTPIADTSAVIIRRLVFWTVLGLVVSYAIHGLRERLRATFTEREELHAAQTESLRRTVALELAAEELTSTLDPNAVVVASCRLLSGFVSPAGVGFRRAEYLRVVGTVVQLAAQFDETGHDLVAGYAVTDHPRLEEAARTGEVSHGALDRAGLGPPVRAMVEALGITHSVHVPVAVEGTVDGVLVISMRDSAASAELVEQCKAVGHLTELALANAFSHQREQDLATTDALTGLANRRAFDQLIAQRPGRAPFTVVVIDVDGLKEVNDSQGHLAGDALLKEVAVALGRATRRGDVLARIGGDEFAVLSFEADLSAAENIARRMLVALRHTTVVGSPPRASIGIASGAPEDDAVEVFNAADAAMYQAKRDGGERYAVARAGNRTSPDETLQ